KDFAEPVTEIDSLKNFLKKLPKILAAESLKEIAKQIRRARDSGKPIIWGIGGHVIKTGLAPVLIDLMRHGFVSAIASNGAVLVHDTEIALVGFTSEDVDTSLGKGDFGAARETGEILNAAAKNGLKDEIGLGEAMGRELIAQNPPNEEVSLICQSYKNKIPFTAHLAIGADIGHFHSSCDGAALGATSHTDFKLFCAIIKSLNGGGVYLNIGSAVILPEIFLKAVTVVRNLDFPLEDFTTANFDFIQSYRPNTNVVRRPTANNAGRGFSITGHHELTIPLLAAQILCRE
ncbi:MAG: deoxyhypusine synthase family protein, partial [Acidobacteriota bacterium]|nr:deoxyhypusine synthase family protein [Acidobacteriota bacterium]